VSPAPTLQVEQFEPAYVVPEGVARATEFGKRYLDRKDREWHKFGAVLRDIGKLMIAERLTWNETKKLHKLEGIPVAVTSGLSQYAQGMLIDHVNGKTSFTMPTKSSLGLWTSAVTVASTGSTAGELTYTTYARVASDGTGGTWASGWSAGSAADPTVAQNASTITFAADTAGGGTVTYFLVCNAQTTGSALWYGTVTSVVISTTQTPPTVASGALQVSLTGT
jgi:hypothetical protein